MTSLRQVVLLVTLAYMAIAVCAAQEPAGSLQKPPMGYELYSWQEPNGRWDFSLLASPSGVNIKAAQVFDKQFLLHGIEQLTRRISRLPSGATIYWLDGISGETGGRAKGSRGLAYPSENVMEQVRQYAETTHVKVKVLREK